MSHCLGQRALSQKMCYGKWSHGPYNAYFTFHLLMLNYHEPFTDFLVHPQLLAHISTKGCPLLRLAWHLA